MATGLTVPGNARNAAGFDHLAKGFAGVRGVAWRHRMHSSTPSRQARGRASSPYLSFNLQRGALLCAMACAASPGMAQEQPKVLEDMFVTATARPEDRSRIAATTQTISREQIERSSAKSITDLLAENAVGFLSEWTAAQTSLNLRGAATDGQGRDYRSQVLVLLNGRRAGTANLSKLSLSDVQRIEIVRGPASVVYGSQNMGGVINIILRSGADGGRNRAQVVASEWGGWRTEAQISGATNQWDWYVGANAGGRGDYQSGSGGTEMQNTGWKRRGATGALGWQIADLHRVELQARTDGIYDAGFRGSGANIYSRDNRYNQSADLKYEGALPGERVSWLAHLYSFHDVDEFN